jgi:N-acetylmuramoyl-L-alanine amidase
MTRPSGTRRTAGLLLALAVVLTAGAPTVIKIKPGDTLWGIARAHHTTVEKLMDLNGIDAPGTIYAGEQLKVPGAPAVRYRTVTRSYTVRSGDTLTGIAHRYGTTVATLRKANRLSRNGLVVIGRTVQVPVRVRVGGAAARPAGGSTRHIPGSVSASVAEHRRVLAARHLPSKASMRRMVAREARRQGVDVSLALAVAYNESGFQQRVVSGVDAIGVMQVLPSTGRALEGALGRRLDLLDPHDNVVAGVVLLKQLRRATGDDGRTLAGYYQGLGSISRKGLLPQTHAYIRTVSVLRPQFRNG